MIADCHAIYFAHEFSRTGGICINRHGRALFDACIDPNPHHIESGLFAFRSPFTPPSISNNRLLELYEKLNWPSVLDVKTPKNQQKFGVLNLSRDKQIIICSMHFAASREKKFKEFGWDRVLECFSVSRNQKDSLVDLQNPVPCWLTNNWRVA